VQPGESFTFQGVYRVQSKTRGSPSYLAGRWAECESGELCVQEVNRLLAEDPLWRGRSRVEIRPAFVSERIGEFRNEPDILYKQSHFTPDIDHTGMPTNIVDVTKAVLNWRERRSAMLALLGASVYADACSLISGLESVVFNEYAVHEAGHSLGFDTATKYSAGYFRVDGKTAWPLVYVEEFRADLLSFGFAANLLEEPQAAALFLYNVLLRLGVHLQARAQGAPNPYGLVPLMLYSLLRSLGWIRPGNKSAAPVQFLSLAPAELATLMRECTAHGREHLAEPELRVSDKIDAAIIAAGYHRNIATDCKVVREFSSVIEKAVARMKMNTC
jgi:hypothetical protein